MGCYCIGGPGCCINRKNDYEYPLWREPWTWTPVPAGPPYKCSECGAWWAGPEHRCPSVTTTTGTATDLQVGGTYVAKNWKWCQLCAGMHPEGDHNWSFTVTNNESNTDITAG